MNEAIAKAVADLEKFAGWEPPESDRAKAMLEAAATLRSADEMVNAANAACKVASGLLEKQTALLEKRESDPEYHANAFSTSVNMEEKKVRFTLYKESNKTGPLGYMILTTPEVYDVAQAFLEEYDKLEGIK
jgi:hypothetical protein